MIFTALIAVSGLITYQFNDFVGQRGDKNASVAIIPDTAQERGGDWSIDAMIGKYKADADGLGHYRIANVRPGKYIVFMRTVAPDGTGDQGNCAGILSPEIPPLPLSLSHCQRVTVAKGSDDLTVDWSRR